MQNDKSAVDEFLGDLKNTDGDEVFDENKSENLFGETPTQEKPEHEDEPQEKAVPFNKDPKILKFIEKELSKRLSEFSPKQTTPEQKAEVSELESAWTELIGNDDPAKQRLLQAIQKTFVQAEERGANRAIEQIEAKRQAEIDAAKRAEQELQDGLDSVEDTFSVDFSGNQKLRTEFLSFMERVAPKNNGEIVAYPDFIESYRTFQELKKPQPNQRARQVASRGIERPEGTTTEKPRGYSWKDVDNVFSNMFGKR